MDTFIKILEYLVPKCQSEGVAVTLTLRGDCWDDLEVEIRPYPANFKNTIVQSEES